MEKHSFINKFSNAYPQESCDNLIKWFEENKKIAKPGLVGPRNKVNNLEISIYLKMKMIFMG